VRAFSFSDTCDPRTPPLGLNLRARGPWTVKYGSFWSIRCPDTRRSTTRSTREPPIWTDPPRSAPIRRQLAVNIGAQRPPQIHRTDARALNNCMSCSSWRSWRTNRHGCAPISRAKQLQGDHETRTRIDNIACYQWPKDRITRLGSPRYRVKPPRLNPNRPESADRAPRADLRGLGPCF